MELSVAESPRSRYDVLADAVLAGRSIDRDDARALLRCPDADVPALLRSTFRVRERFHGRRVKLCVLRNARSGACEEDCHYCSQSAVSEAEIPRYRLDSVSELVANARRAVEAGARRYCMVTSGRSPRPTDIDRFAAAARAIKAEYPALELCVSPGLLDDEQVHTLKAAGIGWINHNLNTSERFHPEICTTHTYQQRLDTLRAVRDGSGSTPRRPGTSRTARVPPEPPGRSFGRPSPASAPRLTPSRPRSGATSPACPGCGSRGCGP